MARESSPGGPQGSVGVPEAPDQACEAGEDHVLMFSDFCPAAPGDFGTLYAVTKSQDGDVLIDALLVEDGDVCRSE